jgi:hypothetical protein
LNPSILTIEIILIVFNEPRYAKHFPKGRHEGHEGRKDYPSLGRKVVC